MEKNVSFLVKLVGGPFLQNSGFATLLSGEENINNTIGSM